MSGTTTAPPTGGVPTDRLEVDNLDQWGRLVKSWATNLDYISQDYSGQPPRDAWVNTTWRNTTGRKPAASTTPVNPAATWALPAMGQFQVSGPAGLRVTLPNAIALSRADFAQKLRDAGVDVSHFPTQYENVVILQGDKNTMLVRLPPMDILQGSEDDLLNGATYRIPAFYAPLYGQPPGTPATVPNGVTQQAAVMQLHANRIGEYTLNNCN